MYFIIFLFTLLLSFKTSWTYNNFTYLSYQNDLRIYFLIWVSSITIFLLYKVIKIYKSFTYISLVDNILIWFSTLTMLIGAFIPYNPNNENIISILHIIISSLGTISLLIIINILINRINLVNNKSYQKINYSYHYKLIIIGMLLIMFGNINTIIELFYTYTILSTLYQIEKTIF